jgi:hypothetical protein
MHPSLGFAGSISSRTSFTTSTLPVLYYRSSIVCILPMCVHSLRRNGSSGFFGRVLHTVVICDTAVGGSTFSSSIGIEEMLQPSWLYLQVKLTDRRMMG